MSASIVLDPFSFLVSILLLGLAACVHRGETIDGLRIFENSTIHQPNRSTSPTRCSWWQWSSQK